jgi:hypothetical protein
MNAEFHDPAITGEIDATTAGWQHQERQDQNHLLDTGQGSPPGNLSLAGENSKYSTVDCL